MSCEVAIIWPDKIAFFVYMSSVNNHEEEFLPEFASWMTYSNDSQKLPILETSL